MNSVVGSWNYKYTKPIKRKRYGSKTTYMLAAAWLSSCETIEDWGCGLAYFKRFCKRSKYTGIDGSMSPYADIIADLSTYKSSPQGILLRHVLEHNWDWKTILKNALDSYQSRMVVVIYTPFSSKTHLINEEWTRIPVLSLNLDEILSLERPFKQSLNVETESIYGHEHLLYYKKALNGGR